MGLGLVIKMPHKKKVYSKLCLQCEKRANIEGLILILSLGLSAQNAKKKQKKKEKVIKTRLSL